MKKFQLLFIGLFFISLFGTWGTGNSFIVNLFLRSHTPNVTLSLAFAFILFFSIVLASALSRTYIYSMLSIIMLFAAIVATFLTTVFIIEMSHYSELSHFNNLGFGPHLAGFSLMGLLVLTIKALIEELRVKKKK